MDLQNQTDKSRTLWNRLRDILGLKWKSFKRPGGPSFRERRLMIQMYCKNNPAWHVGLHADLIQQFRHEEAIQFFLEQVNSERIQ